MHTELPDNQDGRRLDITPDVRRDLFTFGHTSITCPNTMSSWILSYCYGRQVHLCSIWHSLSHCATRPESVLMWQAKPLSVLHVFHHSVVVVMAYLWVDQVQSLQQIALLTNTFIHVGMYIYYFLTSLGYRPPWKQAVTMGQIIQFIFRYGSYFALGATESAVLLKYPACADNKGLSVNMIMAVGWSTMTLCCAAFQYLYLSGYCISEDMAARASMPCCSTPSSMLPC